MILMVRHLTLVLWFSLIPGLALVFWTLPQINRFFPNHDLAVAVAIVAMVLAMIEWAMTRMGERRILTALSSAESWDRAGITSRSTHQYLKALECYESGLISPLRVRRIEPVLLASLAKFSLTSNPSHDEFEGAVSAFLRISPEDGGIASLWLKQLCREKELSRQDHETINQVAEAHLDNPGITALCARLLLTSGRTDYAARKIYRAVQSSSCPEHGILAGIQELMVSDILANDMANGISNKANADDLPNNLADSQADNQADTLADLQSEARFGSTLADTGLETLGSKFSSQTFPRQSIKSARSFKAIVVKIKNLAAALPEILKKSIAPLKTRHAFFRQRESLPRFLKWTTALVGLAVLTSFGINTLIHLVHNTPKETTIEVNKTEKTEKTEKVEKEIPGRFTIQVAAYLKKTHADDFLEELRQKGLKAYIYRADGGGRTWFIVRISQFLDRESAAQYGANLKEQGLIDDFFVDNNEQPIN